nr:MAG TPA: hypothetical protein [Caudoviricetes sp.]
MIYIERIPLKPGQSLSKTQLLILMRKLRSIFQLYIIFL